MHECYYCHAPVVPAADPCRQCGQPALLEGRYQLKRVLGQGGFAIVYEALDTRLDRRCAIKRVAAASLAEQRQVEAEAHILSRYGSKFAFLTHIYDIWSRNGQTYLCMEYIEGQTLDHVSGTAWPPRCVEHFLRTLLGYLVQLHQVGVIHRDLKPKNIVLTPDDRYVLLDFGIAKKDGATLTAAHAASLDYASPEQLQGFGTDARSDLYSLAVTAYELLTGQTPPRADVRLVSDVVVPTPCSLGLIVPPRLEQTLLQMLALDPSQRPADAAAALALLNRPPVLLNRQRRTAIAGDAEAVLTPHLPALPWQPPPQPSPPPLAVRPPATVSPPPAQPPAPPANPETLPWSRPAQQRPGCLRRMRAISRATCGTVSGGLGGGLGAGLVVIALRFLFSNPPVEPFTFGAIIGGGIGGALGGAIASLRAARFLRLMRASIIGAFWGGILALVASVLLLGGSSGLSLPAGLLGGGAGASVGAILRAARKARA